MLIAGEASPSRESRQTVVVRSAFFVSRSGVCGLLKVLVSRRFHSTEGEGMDPAGAARSKAAVWDQSDGFS